MKNKEEIKKLLSKSKKIDLTDEIKNTRLSDFLYYIYANQIGPLTVGELLSSDMASLASKMDYDKIRNRSSFWNVRDYVMNSGLLFDEDKKMYEEANISDELALVRIDDTNLSLRVKNILRRASVVFLGDLLVTDYDTLLRFEHMGKKSATEIRDYAHSLGFFIPEEMYYRDEIRKKYKEQGILTIDEELSLDTRLIYILYKNNIYTIKDLIDYGPKVFKIEGIGNYLKINLVNAMEEKDVSFRIESDNLETNENIEIKKELLTEYNQLLKEQCKLIEAQNAIDKRMKLLMDKLEILDNNEKDDGNDNRKQY